MFLMDKIVLDRLSQVPEIFSNISYQEEIARMQFLLAVEKLVKKENLVLKHLLCTEMDPDF